MSNIGPGFQAYTAIANHPRQKRLEAAATMTNKRADRTMCPVTGISLTAMRNQASSIPGTTRTGAGRTQVDPGVALSEASGGCAASPAPGWSGGVASGGAGGSLWRRHDTVVSGSADSQWTVLTPDCGSPMGLAPSAGASGGGESLAGAASGVDTSAGGAGSGDASAAGATSAGGVRASGTTDVDASVGTGVAGGAAGVGRTGGAPEVEPNGVGVFGVGVFGVEVIGVGAATGVSD